MWPGKDALGQQIYVGSDRSASTTVIGIAEDAVQNAFTGTTSLAGLPPPRTVPVQRGNYLIVRMRGDPAIAERIVRKSVQGVMPGEAM